jgi:S1-C subfamily serine protease
MAKNLGVKTGILIAEVLPHTPAAQSKLRGTYMDPWGRLMMGDIIVAVNAHPVANYDAMYNFLTEIKVGEQITLSIQRGNKQMDVKMHTIDIAAL